MMLNWTEVGKALRAAVNDAHRGTLHVDEAYKFLLDNPECFIDGDEWPADMPVNPNIELIAAYYGVSAE